MNNYFSDIIGNGYIKETLLSSVLLGSNSPKILLGEAGSGRKTLARATAASILGDGRALTGDHIDCVEYECTSATTKDDLRAWAAEATNLPLAEDKRVIILLDLDRVDLGSSDVLLSLFEAPPDFLHLLVTVSNFNRISSTLRSRCSIFRVSAPTYEDTVEILRRAKIPEDEHLPRIRWSSSITELLEGTQWRHKQLLADKVGQFVRGLKSKNLPDYLNGMNSLECIPLLEYLRNNDTRPYVQANLSTCEIALQAGMSESNVMLGMLICLYLCL